MNQFIKYDIETRKNCKVNVWCCNWFKYIGCLAARKKQPIKTLYLHFVEKLYNIFLRISFVKKNCLKFL